MDNQAKLPHAPPARDIPDAPLDHVARLLASSDDAIDENSVDEDVAQAQVELAFGKLTLAGRLAATNGPVEVALTNGAGQQIIRLTISDVDVRGNYAAALTQRSRVIINLAYLISTSELAVRQGDVATQYSVASIFRQFVGSEVSVVVAYSSPLHARIIAVGSDHIDIHVSTTGLITTLPMHQIVMVAEVVAG